MSDSESTFLPPAVLVPAYDSLAVLVASQSQASCTAYDPTRHGIMRLTSFVPALLVYDWLINIDEEVALIWCNPDGRTVASVVYALIRYANILQYVIQAGIVVPVTSLVSCEGVNWVAVILTALVQLVAAVFTAQRAYALSRGKVWLGGIAFLLAIVACVVNLLVSSKWTPAEELPSPMYCVVGDNIPSEQLELGSLTGPTGTLADLLVGVVTWLTTYEAYKTEPRKAFGISLASVMLYDGSLYVITMMLLNIVHMALTAASGIGASYAGLFTDPITSILISHFILDLRRAQRCRNGSQPVSLSFGGSHVGGGSRGSLHGFAAPFAGPTQPSFLSHSDNICDEEEGQDTLEHATDIRGGSAAP
ncbi:hypothetical protein L227DRAFT_565038 [Lentinus tigrinus ALCF2SS1-6]|uniref:DUF6533 domain-containing protein n=1 Tax=Lentinus tigrinus ALCF2SS1-6 TaxID=1328759 RepID=A0A5C2S3T6_9APHY|nr:hypothetical protein L227DRAFT_565038 [Lentinus tigrinus ALCF2SS1-6]